MGFKVGNSRAINAVYFISLAKVKKEGTVEIFQTFLQQVSLYIFLAKKHLT